MISSLDYDGVVRMLRAAAKSVCSGHEELTRLDSIGGDGDHGTTMLRAMNALQGVIDATPPGDIQKLLEASGWAVLGIDGGATGPLFGMFFTGMADAAAGLSRLDTRALAALFEAGLAAVRGQTRAAAGDKTLMDALFPAVAALQIAAKEGIDPAAALQRASAAAGEGAASTENLQARFGRAKNLGPQSVGHRDPGAVSIALMFQGFAQGVQ